MTEKKIKLNFGGISDKQVKEMAADTLGVPVATPTDPASTGKSGGLTDAFNAAASATTDPTAPPPRKGFTLF